MVLPDNNQIKVSSKPLENIVPIKDPNKNAINYYFNENTKKWELIPGAPHQVYTYSFLLSKPKETLQTLLKEEFVVSFDKYNSEKQLAYIYLRLQTAKILIAKMTMNKSLEELKKISPNDNVKTYKTRGGVINKIIAPSTKISEKELKELANKLGVKYEGGSIELLQPKEILTTAQVLFPSEFKFIKNISSQKTNKVLNKFIHKTYQKKIKKAPKSNKVFTTFEMSYNYDHNKFKFFKKTNRLSGYTHLPNDLSENDITGIVNNKRWFQEQEKYQKKLNKYEQDLILSYTYAGDQLIHSWINKTFERKLFENNFQTKFMSFDSRLMPFLPIMAILVSDPKDGNKNKKKISSYFQNNKNDIITMLNKVVNYSDPSEDEYFVLEVLNKNLKKVNSGFYDFIFENYKRSLDKLIIMSPPLQHDLVVYKGVKTDNFLKFDPKTNYFENKIFISTSIDSNVSKSFVGGTCCLLKIKIMKGTKCLFPIFTYFPSELEILFPTGRKYYLTKDSYKSFSADVTVKNIVVVN